MEMNVIEIVWTLFYMKNFIIHVLDENKVGWNELEIKNR